MHLQGLTHAPCSLPCPQLPPSVPISGLHWLLMSACGYIADRQLLGATLVAWPGHLWPCACLTACTMALMAWLEVKQRAAFKAAWADAVARFQAGLPVQQSTAGPSGATGLEASMPSSAEDAKDAAQHAATGAPSASAAGRVE